MGGKNTTTQSTVTVPADVLARYNSVNQRAEGVAQQPFQIYSQDPSAFVAPMNATQNAGVSGTNAYADRAQPYFDLAGRQLSAAQDISQPFINRSLEGIYGAMGSGAAGLGAAGASLDAANVNARPLNQAAGGYYSSAYQGAQPYNQGAAAYYGSGVNAAQGYNDQAAAGLAGAYQGAQPYNSIATNLGLGAAQAVNPETLSAANINTYLSPYLDTVLGRTTALLDQQDAMQQSGQTANAIKQGYFGGDRAGIAAANLAGQQQLSRGKIVSDILNEGYGQALGTAQQQQGLQYTAGTGNRAALGSAAQQLAAIGQQQYGQGTGTAQAQAGLGQQVYGQQMGAGQAIQGLGQQVYGQGTGTGTAFQGLGQQLFGQGLATSQQQQQMAQQAFQQQLAAAQAQAALGQQQYGMGANTAEQLAGLGAGAQGAGLQGAQAQLAAGQVGQQTDQAGRTALYNQFLQQQSYPFQVAQFLANIAMGTGSLSGSTTTTNQPGGFFSDERLKDDVKEVGRTFDGQPIVTYRYKDEPNVVRLGLIAQDVEKKHPGAVGEKSGFKTVDYGKATEAAAKRGKFAYGGMPNLPGLGAADMAALMQQREEMYAPYGGGLYGGSSAGMPNGGSSYVPSSQVTVSPLTIAAPPPAAPSPMEEVASVVELSKGISDTGQELDEWRKKRRAKRAAGGSALDIPDERPEYELKTAEPPGKPESGLKQALEVAKMAAMFMADGGAVQEREKVWGPFYRSSGDGRAYAEARRDAAREANYGLGRTLADKFNPEVGRIRDVVDVARDAMDPKATGPANTLGDFLTRVGAARANAPDAAQPTGQPMAAPQPVSRPAAATTRPAPQRPAQPTPGLAPTTPVPMQETVKVSETLPAPTQPSTLSAPINAPENAPRGGGLGALADGISDSPIGGYFGKLKSGDGPAWMSLLAGIGAMGTAPTVHPGVALAAGLTGGVRAYQSAKESAAEVARTQAETATERQRPPQVQAETAFQEAQTLRELNAMLANVGLVAMEDPQGKYEFGGKRFSTRPKGSLIAQQPSSPLPEAVSAVVGPAGQKVAETSYMTFGAAGPDAQAEAQRELGRVAMSGSEAQKGMLGNREWLGALSQVKEGPLQPGAFNQFGRRYANIFNSAIDLLPVDEATKVAMKFDPEGLTASQIAAKMQNTIAQARAAGVDQNSLGALERNAEATANEGMTRDAAITLAAQELVRAQQDIDAANYFAGIDAAQRPLSGQPGAFLPRDAMTAFWADNPTSKYDAERNKLAEMAKSPEFSKWLKWLHSGDPKAADLVTRYIEKQYGPGMSRYLTGN